MIDDLNALLKRFGPDWGSEIAGDEAPDRERAIILRLAARCQKAEQLVGPVYEGLQLAEEQLDLFRRELALSGSDADDALETAYEGVAEALALVEEVMKQ